jgi:mRNA capping enzyme
MIYSGPPADPFAPTANRSSSSTTIDLFAPKSEIGSSSSSSRAIPVLQSTRGVVTQGHDQIAAANHYDNLKRTKDTQSDSFIYHMKRYNNWVKTMLIHGAEKAKGIYTYIYITHIIHITY